MNPAVVESLSVDQREQLLLAPWAMYSRDSAGRKHPDREHPFRGPFQRDRDRILHSSAYRRLSGKMQVFTGEMGDYHRTRLTHTQEVATVARTIGRVLRLNEDLIEALALMHDIGHPPYGHAGEDALNECAAEIGGFSHNRFALTIVEELEIRYDGFAGLNLTREVLAGQQSRAEKDRPGLHRLLEVQLVDAADSVTYDAHDTDDALKLGLVTLGEMSQLGLIRLCLDNVRQRYAGLDPTLLRKAVVHELVNWQVNGVTAWCAGELARYRFSSASEAVSSDFVVQPGPELREQKQELERFLYERVYRHPRLIRIREEAQQRLKQMVAGYLRQPERFPPHYQDRLARVGPLQMAVEYVAGMTDNFCESVWREMFGGESPRGADKT